MKQRFFWVVAPALAFGLGACQSKKQEQTEPAEAPPAQAATQPAEPAAVPTPPPAPKIPALSPEERAAKLGFAQYLPADTQTLIAVHNGAKTAQRVKASKLWKLLDSEISGASGMSDETAPSKEEETDDFELPEGEQDATPATADAPAGAAEPAEPAGDAVPTEAAEMGAETYFGREFTFAMGKTGSEQFGHLLTLNRRANFLRMRSLARSLAAAAKENDPDAVESAMEKAFGPEFFKEFLADPASGIGLYEKMAMPPIYLAFRTTPETVDAAAQQISGGLGMMAMAGEMVEPAEAERNGMHFAGFKVNGAKISEQIAENRGNMEEELDAATVDRLIAATAKKNLVILTGKVLDYVVIFVGSSVDDFQLAASPGQSVLSGEPLAFTDGYASKELAAVLYGDKNLISSTAAAGGLADIAEGIREGISGSEGLGDTRDLESLLRLVGERENALLKLTTSEAYGLAAFFEDGLKIETFGGRDPSANDWKAPCRLASLGNSTDVALFANLAVLPEFDQKAREYVEALTETGYAIALKAADLPIGEGHDKWLKFKQVTKMFDKEFRADTVQMWNAFYGEFSQGLGSERAWVFDLNGSMPPVPGVPQPLVDHAKIPRVTMVAPVSDRARLAKAWDAMNAGATRILAKVGPMLGQEIPMQKPLSSEKNGYTTWFFGMPSFTDDFIPSVTISDQWFAASSSKNQALDLLGKAGSESVGAAGMTLKVNFQALQKFSSETLQVCQKNAPALFGPDALDEEDVKKAEKAIEALGELDQLSMQCRREGGVMRTSLHWKTR